MHILNAYAIYEHCRSHKLITAFNRQCCSVSYKTMKILESDIAKYTILKSKDDNVPLPSRFSASSFTIGAFDNFDNTDRNSLSGTKHAHDIAITIFQVKPQNPISKPKKSIVELKSIKKLQKLKCQELVFFDSKGPNLPLPDSFEVSRDLLNSEKNIAERNQKQFIMSCAQNITNNDFNDLIPSWAGIESLISQSDVPIMQVGFLPFLPKPVIDYSTVYAIMLNMVKIAN